MNQCQPCATMHNITCNRDPLSGMPIAMAYVPWQTFHHTFELCKGLQMGTIFPELCKPFCGMRGSCR